MSSNKIGIRNLFTVFGGCIVYEAATEKVGGFRAREAIYLIENVCPLYFNGILGALPTLHLVSPDRRRFLLRRARGPTSSPTGPRDPHVLKQLPSLGTTEEKRRRKRWGKKEEGPVNAWDRADAEREGDGQRERERERYIYI